MAAIDMTNKEVFEKVGPDAVKNIIWFGGATAIIVGISKVSWWVGIILAGIFAIIAILDILRVGFVSVLTPIGLVGSVVEKLRGREYEEGLGYMFAAWIAQLAETLVSMLYLYILYQTFFGIPLL